MKGILSGTAPAVDDGVGVDLGDAEQDAIAQFFPALHLDVTEEGAGHFGEEGLDEVEPRAVFGCVDQHEAVRQGGKERTGFTRDVGGVIVEDDADFHL